MVKRQKTKVQTIIYKMLQRKIKTEQHENREWTLPIDTVKSALKGTSI